jgi:CheY-like chemotaxis protein/DNA-binding transcriptional MerR regulator
MSEFPSDSAEPIITIGTLAEKLEVSVASIRRYEEEGLLIPCRTVSGHRMYSTEDLPRVRAIRHLMQDAGLNVEGIRRLQALIPCWRITSCAEELRKDCPSYLGAEKACWMFRKTRGTESVCRLCPVYRCGTLELLDLKHVLRLELENSPAPPGSDRPRIPGEIAMSAKKILIVEDEQDVAKYLSALLQDNGFQTLIAYNGKQGMEIALRDKPDLISLDVSMPEESGVRLYRNLQENDSTKAVPVVIVTGVDHAFKNFIETRKQVKPPDAYFDKPIDKEQYLQKIRALLGME